jgi:hypothetical protein
MHDGGAAVRRALDRGKVQEIITVSAIKASDIVAEAFQMTGHRAADATAMARDEDAHESMIPRRRAFPRKQLVHCFTKRFRGNAAR